MMLVKINLFIKFICLIACSYQASKISEIYFTYQTTTNVKFETTKVEQLPGLTLCHSKIIQLKGQYVGNTSLDKINSWSIEKQRDKFIENMRIMLSCTINNKVNCSEVTEIIGHFDQELYRFTIFAQLNGEPDEKYVVPEENSFKLMISIELLKYANWVVLNFHDRTQPVLSGFVPGNILLRGKDGFDLITYRKTVVKYLFNPLNNPCFESQTHEKCLIECQIKEFIENTGKHPPINLARSNSSLYFANMSEYELFQWSDRCEKMCGRFTDCYKEYYFIKDGETPT